MNFNFKKYSDTEVIIAIAVLSKLESENASLKDRLKYEIDMIVDAASDEIKKLNEKNARLREALDEAIKHLNTSYNWGLFLFESEDYQEMEDEDEKENMKTDLDTVYDFINNSRKTK